MPQRTEFRLFFLAPLVILLSLTLAQMPLSAQRDLGEGIITTSEHGALYEGTFDDSLTAVLPYEGKTGDIISMQARGDSSIPTSISFVAPDGTELSRTVPFGETYLSIGGVQLPADGIYTITLTSAQPGDYTIVLMKRHTPQLAFEWVTYEYFHPTVHKLDFSFEGLANQHIILTALSDEFDPVLMFYAPDGQLIATDDDSGGDLDAQIAIELPQTGTYRVILSSYYPGNQGDFEISVRLKDATRINYGETREVLLSGSEYRLDFWGQAGEVIEVSALDIDDAVAEVRVEQSYFDIVLASSHNPDGLERFTLTEDASLMYPHQIVIRRRTESYASLGRVRISLIRRDQDTLDLGRADVFISPKNPVAELHFETENNYTILNVHQQYYRPSIVVPFQITVTAEDGKQLASYIFDQPQQIAALDIGIRFHAPPGRVIVRIELLNPQDLSAPVWFNLTRDFSVTVN